MTRVLVGITRKRKSGTACEPPSPATDHRGTDREAGHVSCFPAFQIRLPGSSLAKLCVFLLLTHFALAVGLPEFASDQEADRWFRENSASYRKMAEAADAAGGYTIEPFADTPGGLAWFENGKGHVGLNPVLTGPTRFSILIFEVTNLFQESKHQGVADRVRCGELNNPAAFALWREMIEFDGIRLHQKVLQELEPAIGTIPPGMITWISSTAKTFAEYQPPLAYDYLKAQQASGHTAHYLRLFEKHRAEFLAKDDKAK